jgi:hypothetical protein
MTDIGRGVVFGPGSTISEAAAILLLPESNRLARHRVRRRCDYPAAFGLDLRGDESLPSRVQSDLASIQAPPALARFFMRRV